MYASQNRPDNKFALRVQLKSLDIRNGSLVALCQDMSSRMRSFDTFFSDQLLCVQNRFLVGVSHGCVSWLITSYFTTCTAFPVTTAICANVSCLTAVSIHCALYTLREIVSVFPGNADQFLCEMPIPRCVIVRIFPYFNWTRRFWWKSGFIFIIYRYKNFFVGNTETFGRAYCGTVTGQVYRGTM